VSEGVLVFLQSSGALSHLDLHFARFMERMAGEERGGLALAAALASSYTRSGHVCLDLSAIAGKLLDEREASSRCPALGRWRADLEESSVVGKHGEYKPLILDARGRLYLYRYWRYQETLALAIKQRVSDEGISVDMTRLREGLERLFSPSRAGAIDWQKVAAAAALRKRFCVISGGPGTGKTSTVARILALLVEQARPGEKLRIALAAPTGKAAAKLQETIRGVKQSLHCLPGSRGKIPEDASTLHRLLGWVPGSPYFRHNADNPLPVDVMVVDEASMVDLALMSKLVQALPCKARLLLLGDKDQLASVEAGAVLGDICDTGSAHSFSERLCDHIQEATGYIISGPSLRGPASNIHDAIIQLQQNFRFTSGSGIGTISREINRGDSAQALTLLARGAYNDVVWRELPQPHDFPRLIRDRILDGYGAYLQGADPGEVLERFDRFRILCAHRAGPFGASALNTLAERILKEEGTINPGSRWYRGRPLLINANDYPLRLFNGDVGVVLPDPDGSQELRVFFPAPDGSLRKFHPLRLPEHETVYAMTVHKSQGSEFGDVLLVLPERLSPVLTRELIYTGITRAKQRVEIWGKEDVFLTAVSRRIERSSGLRDALWKNQG